MACLSSSPVALLGLGRVELAVPSTSSTGRFKVASEERSSSDEAANGPEEALVKNMLSVGGSATPSICKSVGGTGINEAVSVTLGVMLGGTLAKVFS